MDNPIKVGNGILEQIKYPYYISGTINKKGIFDYWIKSFNLQ